MEAKRAVEGADKGLEAWRPRCSVDGGGALGRIEDARAVEPLIQTPKKEETHLSSSESQIFCGGYPVNLKYVLN